MAYVIHLNMEMNICVLNSPWISNNFLFTILSGAFASVIIALLIEVRQYKLNKVIAKNQIFRDATLFYGQISIIKYTLLRIKEHPSNIISPDIIAMPVSMCNLYRDSLHGIDYSPFFRRDKLSRALKEMDYQMSNQITQFLLQAPIIQQAVIQDKIKVLEQTGNSVNPTYNSYYCKLTVDKLLENIIPIVDKLTSCMQNIADGVGQKERWKQIYKDFTHFEENYDAPSLEKYLGL